MVWHLSSDLGDSWEGLSLPFTILKLPATSTLPGRNRIARLQKLLMDHGKQRRIHFCSGNIETLEIKSVFLLEVDKSLNLEENFVRR